MENKLLSGILTFNHSSFGIIQVWIIGYNITGKNNILIKQDRMVFPKLKSKSENNTVSLTINDGVWKCQRIYSKII